MSKDIEYEYHQVDAGYELGPDEEWVTETDWVKTLGRPYKLAPYFDDFIKNFLLDPSNKTEALRQTGYVAASENSMRVTAHNMYKLLSPYIFEKFEEHKKIFALLGHNAIVDVVNDDEAPHREKLQAGKLLMDYGGHKPSEKIEVDIVDMTSAREKALGRMKDVDNIPDVIEHDE